jgi:hypothetical protein
MSLGSQELERAAEPAGPRQFRSGVRMTRGWLLSFLVHGTALFSLSWILTSEGGGPGLSSDGGYGSTNLNVVRSEPPAVLRIEESPPLDMAAGSPPQLASQMLNAPREVAPRPPRMPNESNARIKGSVDKDLRAVVGNGRRGRGLGGSGGGETSFFGIRDRGLRFCFVIDNSGSMSTNNAIDYAKAEILGSLASLDASQQFQILFYNELPRPFVPEDRSGGTMYPATESNRELAREFVLGTEVAGGTDHMPALRAALGLRPDVLYFLTDAGVPVIRAGDLDEIRQLNGGRTRIHCIEFGRGPELNVESSLRVLARQNGGVYAYRDISRLAAK